MSGTAIVRYLLANHAGLTALVPATRIMAGVAPVEDAYPAISVKQVSSRQHNNLAMGSASYLVTDRVQVAVMAQDVDGAASDESGYVKVKEILVQVRAALPLSRGTVNGFTCDAVLPDIAGPDFYDEETGLYMQSADYLVTYHR